MRAIVAGYGSIGRRHAANLRSLCPDCELAVLRRAADGVRPDVADKVFCNLDDALAFSPDIAFICTPAPSHVALARRFLSAGAHIFVEKPLSHDLSGVDELAREAAEARRTVLVGYHLAFLPSMRFLRQAIRSGMIGQVLSLHAEVGQFLPDWRPGTDHRNGVSAKRDTGGGALLELSHELHYLAWLMGPVSKVQAMIRNTGTLGIEAEDLAAMLLQFEQGAVGTVQLDFLQRSYSRTCRLVGSEGTLLWDGADQAVKLYRPGQRSPMDVFGESAFDRNSAYLRELEHFIACTEGRASPEVALRDAKDVLRLVLAARKSSETGRMEAL